MNAERRGAVKPRLAALAMGLAGLGVGVSLVGFHLASLLLEQRIGPALTVAGAVLWIVARWRTKGE